MSMECINCGVVGHSIAMWDEGNDNLVCKNCGSKNRFTDDEYLSVSDVMGMGDYHE